MATTQTTYPSQWTAEGLFNLWNSAGALANAPYSPYTGEVYAGANQQQLNAINGLNGIGSVSNPYFDLGGDWMKGAMATTGFTGQPFAQGATYLSNAAGYGDAATGYNNQAGLYGQQAANYVGQGAGYANQAANIGNQALAYGQQASGLVNQGAGYGSQAAKYVNQGNQYAGQAANIASGALGYGQQAAGLVNDGRQYGQQAAGMIGQGSQYGAQAADYAKQLGDLKITPMAFSAQALQQYLDPGQQALVDATMNTLQRQNAQQQNALMGNAIAKGAWGGDRAGVAQAELMGQQGLVNAQTVADLNSRNYSQALGMFNQQQGVDLQRQLANANNLGQASGLLSNIGGLYGQFGNSLLGAGNLSNSLAGTMLGAGNLQNSVANTYAGLGNLSNQFAGSMLGAGNLYNSLAGTTNQTGALANNVANMYSGLGSLSNQFGNTMLGAGNLSLGQGQLALGQGQLNMGLGNASTNLGSAISGVGRDQAAIASMYAGLGPAAQNAQLQGYLAQLQGGNQLQADKQAWLDSMYNTWNQNQQGPYNQLGWLSNVYQGINPQLGSTTVGSGQQGNSTSDIIGAGAAGVGAVAKLLPALTALSDERAKEDIEQIGETYDGQPIHRFKYKGAPQVHVGLMAQEVEKRDPGAVHQGADGLKRVDLDRATRPAADRGGYADGGSVLDIMNDSGMPANALQLAQMLREKYGAGDEEISEPTAPIAPPDVGGSAIRDALRFTQGLGATGLGFAVGGQVSNDNSVAKALREIAPTVKAIKGAAKPAMPPAARRPNAGLGGMRMAKAQRPRYAVGGSVVGDQEDRRRQAMEFYMRQGYSPAQAAGMVGNLMAESGLNSVAVGDNGTSFGAGQWRGSRRNDLVDFAKGRDLDPNAFDTQLRYSNMELQGPEAAAGAKIRGASTPQEAATAATDFFRPAGWKRNDPSNAMHLNDRVQNALELAKQFGGAGAADMPAAGAVEAQQKASAPAPEGAWGNVNKFLGDNGDVWDSLMAFGLATLAGKDKNAWRNIGQGGLVGLQAYDKIQDKRKEEARDAELIKLRQAADARDERNAVRQEKLADLQGQNILSQIEERKAGMSARPDWKPVTVKGPDGTESTIFQRGNEFATADQLGIKGQQGATNPYANGKFNEGQGKAAGFADRMAASNSIISGLTDAATSKWEAVKEHLPIGEAGRNAIASEDRQKFNQAQRDFVNAVLRRESGAVISPEEFENARQQYFPQPGDSPDVIRQKAINRQRSTEGIMREAGPAYKPPAGWGAGTADAPRVSSKSEFDRLPSGTEFIDPEGNRRRKP